MGWAIAAPLLATVAASAIGGGVQAHLANKAQEAAERQRKEYNESQQKLADKRISIIPSWDELYSNVTSGYGTSKLPSHSEIQQPQPQHPIYRTPTGAWRNR